MKFKTAMVILMGLFASLLLAACSSDTAVPPQTTLLSFPVNLVVQDDGDAKISAGLRNDGLEPFPGAETFNGALILRRADSGALRARAELHVAEPLAPGESAFPLGWEGQLAPGEYQMVWGAPDYGIATTTFTVLGSRWTMLSVNAEADASMLQLDPALQSYVDQSRDEVAARELFPVDEITLLRVEAIPTAADTYRIDLGANGRVFTYHANDDGVTSLPPK